MRLLYMDKQLVDTAHDVSALPVDGPLRAETCRTVTV